MIYLDHNATTPVLPEVFDALGDTIAVTSVPESALEPLLPNEVFSVRRIAVAA